MKVSIVMPMYNAEAYLNDALMSVKNQSFKNWELIVVDDGSTDQSTSIVEEYIKEDSRIRLFTQKNSGPATAKNTGLKNYDGDFVMFLDSDDMLVSNALEILVNVQENERSDLIVFSYVNMKESGELMKVQDVSYTQIDMMFTGVWNKLYSKALISDLSFPEGTVYEDVAFSAGAAMMADYISVVSSNIPLYLYRERKSSITHTKSWPIERRLDIAKDFFWLFDFVNKNSNRLTESVKFEIELLVNTMVYSHSREVAENLHYSAVARNKVISELLYVQEALPFLNTYNYSRNFAKNIKQRVFIYLLRKKMINTVAILGFINDLLLGKLFK